MFRWIGKLLEGIFALAGALALSQAPLYMQYYTQQLSGHVSELKLQIFYLERAASQTGKSLGLYVQKFLSSTDQDFRIQGQLMQGMLDRFQILTEQLHALQSATVLERPFIFSQSLQWDIARETMHSFELGLTLSVEGAVYAFLGMLLGYLLFFFLRVILRIILSLLMPRKEKRVPIGHP